MQFSLTTWRLMCCFDSVAAMLRGVRVPNCLCGYVCVCDAKNAKSSACKRKRRKCIVYPPLWLCAKDKVGLTNNIHGNWLRRTVINAADRGNFSPHWLSSIPLASARFYHLPRSHKSVTMTNGNCLIDRFNCLWIAYVYLGLSIKTNTKTISCYRLGTFSAAIIYRWDGLLRAIVRHAT